MAGIFLAQAELLSPAIKKTRNHKKLRTLATVTAAIYAAGVIRPHPVKTFIVILLIRVGGAIDISCTKDTLSLLKSIFFKP